MIMRKFFLGILTLLLLVSCGKRQDSEEGLAIFKYNESAGILTLDPIYAKDLPHIWACNQVFNSLVAFDDKMNLVPMVAKSWDISEDGKTYTFHLRDDVRFHEDTCFYQSALRQAQGPSQHVEAKVVEPVEIEIRRSQTPTDKSRFVTAQTSFILSTAWSTKL